MKTYWKTFYQSYNLNDVTEGKNNQFKADILNRFGEPGVHIQFKPILKLALAVLIENF